LIHLRRTTVALNDGDVHHLKVECQPEKRWLSMQRGSVRVLVNLGAQAEGFKLKPAESVRLCSKEMPERDGMVLLPAMSLAVLMRGDSSRIG
jgi:maltooligosyltrehalose trehalohydrolase